MGLGLPTGERSGLAPTGTLRGLQFLAQSPDFFLQPLGLFLQPLVVLFQLPVPLAGLIAFLPRTAQFLHQFPDTAERVEGLEKQIIL